MLAAEQVAKTVQSGAHGRKRAGSGEAFWQFRNYDPLESASRIDWRQSAKRDRLAVREREWDAVQSAYIWLDDSASMHYASHTKTGAKKGTAKITAARVLALALSNLLMRGGESVGSLDMAVKAGANKLKSEELAVWLCQTRDMDFPAGNAQVPAFAQQIWFSDFLMPKDDLKSQLRQQTQKRQTGVLVQIVDPAEFSLPFTGRTKFTGLEGEADWTVQKTEGIGDLYATRWREHCDELQALTKAAGWSLVQVNTAEVLSVPLSRLYNLLAGAKLKGAR